MYKPVFVASGPFPATRDNLGEGRRSYFGIMGKARWVVPLPEITLGLGQCPHASLGTVADVSKPRVLFARSTYSDKCGVYRAKSCRLSTSNSQLPTSTTNA